jgi:precorrin-3B synthase
MLPVSRACNHNSKAAAPVRLGANFCPGILHAVPAKDGLLMRIRIPGGLITANQISTIADLAQQFADGTLEITSRANLQLRSIQDQDLAGIAATLASAGLLPSPKHDRVRNIATSPLVGLDAGENIDTRPLVRELDRRLTADTALAHLHPKFSFAVYGSSKRYSHDSDDLSLEALNASSGSLLRLSIGGIASGFAVAPCAAIDCMVAAAKVCITLANEAGIHIRGRQVIALPAAMEQILEAISPFSVPCPLPAQLPTFVETHPGIYPAIEPGHVNLIPSIPLGRLSAEQAHLLANTALAWNADLRLAPWRGIVLGSIPKHAANTAAATLNALGLTCDGQDGYSGIAACAGISGCDASLLDVRGDAASLAERLAGQANPPQWTVNFSGCQKQCGRRHEATAELIAEASGYTLRIKSQPAASGCSSASAITAVTDLHTALLAEVAST